MANPTNFSRLWAAACTVTLTSQKTETLTQKYEKY